VGGVENLKLRGWFSREIVSMEKNHRANFRKGQRSQRSWHSSIMIQLADNRQSRVPSILTLANLTRAI